MVPAWVSGTDRVKSGLEYPDFRVSPGHEGERLIRQLLHQCRGGWRSQDSIAGNVAGWVL